MPSDFTSSSHKMQRMNTVNSLINRVSFQTLLRCRQIVVSLTMCDRKSARPVFSLGHC